MQRSAIFLENKWYDIPQSGGMIPGTTLHARWLDDRAGAFELRKLVLTNKWEQSVKLGSCHLFETSEVE